MSTIYSQNFRFNQIKNKLLPYGKAFGEFFGSPQRLLFIFLPNFCDGVIQRIIRIGRRKQGLDAQQDGANLQRGGPLVLQNVEANSPKLVDVGMVNFGKESDFGGGHGIIRRQEELELEHAPLIGRVGGALDGDREVA